VAAESGSTGAGMRRGSCARPSSSGRAKAFFFCAWARAYYDQQKTKGKHHWAIVRALAFKWLRILWKCWITRTPYDESRYVKALTKRKSTLIPATAATKT